MARVDRVRLLRFVAIVLRAAVRRTVSVLALIILAALAWPQAAHAHASITVSDPANGALGLAPPEAMTLSFNEPVSAQFSQGMLVFGVGSGADLAALAAPLAEPPAAPAEVLLRWLHYALLIGLFGGLVVATSLFKPAESAPTITWRDARQRALRLAAVCALFAFVAGLGLLALQTDNFQQMTPTESGWLAAAQLVLLATQWGRIWLLRQTLLLVVAALLFHQSRQNRREQAPLLVQGATWLLTLAVLVAQALSGHASDEQQAVILALTMAVVHLLAAGLWIGGLLARRLEQLV